MTAICKTIPIHGSTTSPLMQYCANKDKTSISKNAENLQGLFDYGADPLKTICGIDEDHKELLITGIHCTPETAAEEFAITKEKYLALRGTAEEFDKNYDPSKGHVKRQAVIAIHMIQSFNETNIDPRVAHEIGVRLAESVGCQAVVDTHMNREHVHNHIILNSYLDTGRKVALNKDFILNMRELSDELQKEYGIPITFEEPREQLKHKQRGTLSRKEWDLSIEGKSWKDQMRYDIAAVSEIAKDREEYIQLMESYGYKVEKETPKYITFFIEENGRKISDKTLGEDYTVGSLFPPNKEKEKDPRIKEVHRRKRPEPFMGKPISIARYDADGTKRSLLEMILRKAIAIIQRIGNFFFDDRYNSVPNNRQSPKYKIEILNGAIDTIRKYDVAGATDLENKIEATGATLSHAKRNLRIAEIEKNLVEMADSALTDIEMLSMVKTSVGELHLHDYAEDEVKKTRAKIAPMTSKQRKDLSRNLGQREDLRLTCRFDEISCMDAEKLLGYFNGKESKRPDILATQEEYNKQRVIKTADGIHERQASRAKERFGDVKPKENQLKQAMSILEKRGISVDPDSLSQFDVMDIRSCFGDNPFESPLISEEQQELLMEKIKENNLELNRDIHFITMLEFNHLMRYIDGKTKAVPSFIGQREEPTEADISRLHDIMEAKGISSSVPIEKLSKNDFNKMYTFAVYAGHLPEVLQPIDKESNSDKDNMFYARVSQYNMSRSLHLSQLRNAYNTLRSLGFDVSYGDDLSYIRKEVDAWNKSFDEVVKTKEELSTKYSDLIKVKQTTKLAVSPSFLYGDLFNPDVDKEVPVEEKEERDTRTQEEDRKYRHMEKEPDDDISL